MRVLCFLLMLVPLSLYASKSQTPLSHKGLIETYDLEAQTIVLNGQQYEFAPAAIIWGPNQELVGFRGLNTGQMVSFEINKTQDKELITKIQIISDNRGPQKDH